MSMDERIRVAHWFTGSEKRQESELHDHELQGYIETLRQLRRYSAALRVAVNDVEVDLGVQAAHTW